MPINVQVFVNSNTDGEVTGKVSTSLSTPKTFRSSHSIDEEHFNETIENTFITGYTAIKPWKVAAVLTGSGFCYLFYIFRKTEQMLHQPQRWFNWNENLETEKLETLPCDDVTQQLITAIQHHYTATKYIHDFVQPLRFFLTDVDEEAALLKRYIKLGSFVQKLWLGKLLGINDTSLQQAEDKLVRLEILKKMFTAWSTEFKLGQRSFSK